MSNFYIRKLLDENTINTIVEWMSSNYCEYEEGIKTLSGDNSIDHKRQLKKNEEATGPSDVRDSMRDMVFQAIDDDSGFFSFTAPDSSGSPMFTKTYPGGYYKPHQDAPSNGDFSTTVFLSDPETYGGGSLRLLINGQVEQFKLPAGYAITYKTGIPHQVECVEYGNRYVSVFWTTSLFLDDNIRKYWGTLSNIVKTHNLDNYDANDLSLENACKSTSWMLNSLMYDMQRDYRR